MPKVDIATVPARKGSGYPSPFDAPCAARTRRRLGDAGTPKVQGTARAPVHSQRGKRTSGSRT